MTICVACGEPITDPTVTGRLHVECQQTLYNERMAHRTPAWQRWFRAFRPVLTGLAIGLFGSWLISLLPTDVQLWAWLLLAGGLAVWCIRAWFELRDAQKKLRESLAVLDRMIAEEDGRE